MVKTREQKLQELLESIDPDKLIEMLTLFSKKEDISQDNKDQSSFENPITTKGKSIAQATRPNKFLDMKFSAKEKQELDRDKEVDKQLLDGIELAPRERNPSRIKVKCSICNKEETVNRSLVLDVSRYRCNTCCIGGKHD